MQSYLTFASFAGSIFSTLATVYFWFVRMRHERPNLKPHLLDKEWFLGVSRDDTRQLGLKLGLIVANYSVLPNAILGARLWVRGHDGWQEMTHLAFDKQTPLPFNVPSMHTVLLRLSGTLSLPYQDSLEEGNKTVGNYLHSCVSQPLELKLELRRLNDRTDTHVLSLPASEAATPALRLVSAAA